MRWSVVTSGLLLRCGLRTLRSLVSHVNSAVSGARVHLTVGRIESSSERATILRPRLSKLTLHPLPPGEGIPNLIGIGLIPLSPLGSSSGSWRLVLLLLLIGAEI